MPRNLLILSYLFASAIFLVSSSSITLAWEATTSPYAQSQPLRMETVLSLVETQHPLLHGSRTEKLAAQGTLLKALGAFEPILVNDFEVERLVKDGQTKSVGFNDTMVQMRHPSGLRGFAGWR
nr:TolC family protein [Nitrospirales bacterium]